MPPVITDAIVLHAFDYLETSRILRLLTRDAGIHSVLAKGARRSRGKVGSAVDLFAEGEVQLYLKPGRELQSLAAFDVTKSRTALAFDIERFSAASAIAELLLRLGKEDANPTLYDTVVVTLDDLASAPVSEVVSHALSGAWRIVAVSGFAPSLDDCASCHAPLERTARVPFSHPAGGVLCERCAQLSSTRRQLPPEARDTLRTWLEGDLASPLDAASARAHQRLLREFLTAHILDDRPLRAFAVWEHGPA